MILLPAARRVFPSAAHGALALLFALALVSPRVGHAQSSVSAGVTAAVARARTLANDGEDAKSRALLDSVVNGVSRDSFDAAEALYWRALLAEGSATAELDWKRIVVDVPFSPRASEALFKLSELDLQRANRTLARQHVQQLLNDYPTAPERPRAMLVLARSYFDERDAPRGCGVLTAVRKEAPLSAVEVRLQADELQQQCRNVRELALGAAPDPTVVTTPAAVPPLATQTAALPPVAPPTTAARPTRGTTVNADSVRRDSTARAAETRNATRAIADSIRRDSVARFAVSRTAAKQAADSIRRDSVARVTASRTAARQAADSIRRDSIVRAIAQRVVDSTRRDSVAKAGLLRAAAQRIADNARRDSLTRETLRRDSIALDKIRPSGTGSTTGRGGATAPAGTASNAPREVLVFISDSARADSLSREAAALELRIRGAVAARDSAKRDSVARVAAKRAADARAGKWTIQVAAYPARADADALVKRLAAKDVSARVVGTKKPYRVQVGRYGTKAEAAAALATLKKNGQKTGFVAELGK